MANSSVEFSIQQLSFSPSLGSVSVPRLAQFHSLARLIFSPSPGSVSVPRLAQFQSLARLSFSPSLDSVSVPRLAQFQSLAWLSLPGKKTFNNMNQEFLEKRRVALNAYLQVGDNQDNISNHTIVLHYVFSTMHRY